MHREAEECETQRLASQCDGGIVQAFSARVLVNRKALIGALKMVYWLAKEEIASATKFCSLMDLSIQLGSEQTITELLQCLSPVTEEQILEYLQSNEFFALMTDESTDVAVLKQLVLVTRYMTKGDVKTSFLHIRDIQEGESQHCILQSHYTTANLYRSLWQQ